jgi:methylenetetrahydrofolate dehydrogenase (NADP+)/methenyltetrahydrofolate cyclohydrolase
VAQLLDGKALAQKILKKAAKEVETLSSPPKLVVIQVGADPASSVYVNNKKKACEAVGIISEVVNLPENTSHEEVITRIKALNQDPLVSAMIVQLPVPQQINVPKVMKAIDPSKDADGFCAYNLGKMFLSKDYEHLPPATPSGIIALLSEYQIEVRGLEAVVVGHSNIVGKPISTMLLNRGATVTTCHIDTKDLKAHTLRADLLVVAVGKQNLITAKMVKEGVIVIDVGMNRCDQSGKLCGDVDFEAVKERASLITPVPGGVGPMTVAALILNTITAHKRQRAL